MFNELSLCKVTSIEIAREVLNSFVECQSQARQMGFREIRLHERALSTLYEIELHKNYRIDSWLSDNLVNTDLKDFFREIITSSPLLNEQEIKDVDIYNQSAFYKSYEGTLNEVWGLGAAYIYFTLCASIPTHQEWGKPEVIVSHYFIDSDYNELTKDVCIKHFSNSLTLLAHKNWWIEYQADRLKASKELWEKREIFFPNIILCEEVEKQIEKLGVSKTLFQIFDRLRELDEYVKNWTVGSFNTDDLNQNTNLRVSGESVSTINKFGSLRKFTVPSQGKKIFDLHIKTGDLRFHFYPDNEKRTVYVGYIGKHLRISSED